MKYKSPNGTRNESILQCKTQNNKCCFCGDVQFEVRGHNNCPKREAPNQNWRIWVRDKEISHKIRRIRR